MASDNQFYLPPRPVERPYRVSIFWPVLLIGAGVVLLLSNMNYLQGNVWDWAWRLWPLIFIAGGLDALIRGEFVGAVLGIGLGGLFLASTFGYFTANPLEIILGLWPLFLVSAGLSLVFSRRNTGWIGSLVGALVMVAILAFAAWQLNGLRVATATVDGPRVTQALEGATKADITVAPVAGSVSLKALPEGSALVDGIIRLPDDQSLKRSFSVRNGVAYYTLNNGDVYVGVRPLGADWDRWDLGINPDIPVTLRVSEAAGDVNLDLSGLQVTDVRVDMAVGSTTVTLPQGRAVRVNLNSALGATVIYVPPETGVRVVDSSALSGVDMPAGYIHSGNVYKSPNYNSTANHVDINVSVAMGTLSVRTQTGR